MCGIAGFWGGDARHLEEIIARMAARLEHRGPDDSGTWCDETQAIALGHRRLSIVDLSAAGHQPFVSACGRFVLIFNGEIYNHEALRSALSKPASTPQWRGHSDTETLITCLVEWGVEKTLHRIIGMFAFALWDREKAVLTLARDRLGEKPLYYGWAGNTLLFASELKALAAHPSWQGRINESAVSEYLRYGYVPDPLSVYTGIKKLSAGHWVELSSPGAKQAAPKCYWDLESVAREGISAPLTSGNALSTAALEKVIDASVKNRLMADVPVGVFLSGGYDSVAIAASAQAQSSQPIDTFTIGFSQNTQDEAGHAKAIAAHIGTWHHEHYVGPSDVIDTVPYLANVYDEPFGDTSQIPTLLLSRFASSKTKVVLAGDGGDELFEGYQHYSRAR